MILNFEIENYRSFKYLINFSMVTGPRLKKYNDSHTMEFSDFRLLKSAVIFGANAHGKTNLLKGISYLKSLVTIPTITSTDLLYTDTFSNNDNPTSVKIEFIKNNKLFSYFIKLTQKEVLQEELLIDESIIFQREQQNYSTLPEDIKPIAQTIRKNQLLLYYCQQQNVESTIEAFDWFVNDLITIDPQLLNPNNGSLLARLNIKSFKEKFISCLQAADFNIEDVEVIEDTIPGPHLDFNFKNGQFEVMESFKGRKVKKLLITHAFGESDTFKTVLENESNGTIAFILIALSILVAQEEGNKVLLIDEFNNSFHIELAQALFDLINSEVQKNQFIVTTHEISLMDYNLRQDQIYFAEKKADGSTEIFSLFDFDDVSLKRQDFGHKKRYLNGRYGAKAIVSSSLMQSILEEDERDRN